MSVIGNKGLCQDFTIRQGTDEFSYPVILQNDNNTPVNLTGCIISARLRKTIFNGAIYIINTQITDAVNGKFKFWLTSEETLLIMAGGNEDDPASQYKWNLDITYSNGEIRPLFYGKIYVLAAIPS